MKTLGTMLVVVIAAVAFMVYIGGQTPTNSVNETNQAANSGTGTGGAIQRQLKTSAFPLDPRLLKLNHERLQRRLTKIRFRRAHMKVRAPEFPKLFIGHSSQAFANLILVCGYFHSAIV
jgi:hypothetical protein